MSAELWEWWEFTLTEPQRRVLMALPDAEVPPDLAVQLWKAGPPVVLSPKRDRLSDNGFVWILAPDVAAFTAERGHERRHPDDFH
jgi:hypothetical protein